MRIAYQRRIESDYVFEYWTALGWTVLTCGIFGYYVVYQLVRRMRDHNRRRLDLLEAGIAFAWEQAQSRPAVADELRPTFAAMAANLAVLRQMTSEFRDPAVWTLLAVLSSGISTAVAFVLLDGDLVRHTAAERAVQADLGRVYLRLGHDLGPGRASGEGPPQLLGPVRGHPLQLRPLPPLVVPRPHGRAQPPLRRGLGLGGPVGHGRLLPLRRLTPAPGVPGGVVAPPYKMHGCTVPKSSK